MKTLIACRHAHAREIFDGSDHDRPLSNRGTSDCQTIGRILLNRAVEPEAILSSSAQRAITTARLIAEELNFPDSKIKTDGDWYLAPSDTWLHAVQQISEDTATAFIFGHNPGMADFVFKIQSEPDYISFPPLSMAVLQLNVDFWGEVEWNSGKLVEHIQPG